MGKLAPIAWPEGYSELQRIEELLLCGICYDYMDTSVMTPCSHNYCSLCIRKYLHYKTQCPACFEKTFEKDLHTNRILDELVTYFGKIREKLVNCISGAKILTNENAENIQESLKNTPVRPARMNQNLRKTSPTIEKNFGEIDADNTEKSSKIKPIVTEPQNIHSSPSTSGVPRVAKIFTPRSKKSIPKIANVKTVPCPVCAVEVSTLNINKHLDDCLKRENVTQQPPKNVQKRKPLPKLVFSLMKDTEMRKKMKELGLPSQGDRKTLESRFQRYSILYNAECDKQEPRTIEELLKICENEENLEKKMLKFAQAADRLKVTRSSEQKIIEEAQKKYLETNRQNYNSLIESIKEREKSGKALVRRSLIDQPIDQRSEVSKVNEIADIAGINEESNDAANYSMNAYEATFLDSDSDSCPLQHYASDDPLKFLSFTMSTSEGTLSPQKSPPKSRTLSPQKSSPKSRTLSPQRSPPNSRTLSPQKSPPKSRTLSPQRSPPKSRTLSLQKSSSKSGSLMQRKNHDCQDPPVSPMRKVTPKNTNSKSAIADSSRLETSDIFNATTDNDTSDDEDAVPPSPKATTCHRKRPKLSLKGKNREKIDDRRDIEHDNSEGRKLAMSIARDFTFDTSSNDSVGSAVNATVNEKTSEEPSVGREEAKIDEPDIAKLDKENQESVKNVVNRPLRKRNCVVRSQTINVEDSARIKEKVAVSQDDFSRSDDDRLREDKKLACTSRDVKNSPLKRRRRRKVTPDATETTNPPRRPLRKCHVNAILTDNAHKRS